MATRMKWAACTDHISCIPPPGEIFRQNLEENEDRSPGIDRIDRRDEIYGLYIINKIDSKGRIDRIDKIYGLYRIDKIDSRADRIGGKDKIG